MLTKKFQNFDTRPLYIYVYVFVCVYVIVFNFSNNSTSMNRWILLKIKYGTLSRYLVLNTKFQEQGLDFKQLILLE
jgi:hypothetical protein